MNENRWSVHFVASVRRIRLVSLVRFEAGQCVHKNVNSGKIKVNCEFYPFHSRSDYLIKLLCYMKPRNTDYFHLYLLH